MIKIGCAAYSYRDYLNDGRMEYEQFIEEAHRIRLDGVELTLYWLHSSERDYLRRLERLALWKGLPISCAGISTDFCKPLASEREKTIKAVIDGLNTARELGAPVLRVFAGYVPDDHKEQQAMEWVTQSLRACVSYAEEAGVVIALENHGGVTARADSVIRMIRDVGSPWLQVNLDLGNYKEGTYDDIAKTIPYAAHMHGKIRVAGGAEVDYERVRDLLQDGGYNGFISIEYEEKEDCMKGVPKFANHLFDVFRRSTSR